MNVQHVAASKPILQVATIAKIILWQESKQQVTEMM